MAEEKKIYWNSDRIVWLIIGIVLTVSIIWAIYYLRDALLPFFVACLVAYLLQPLVRLNQKITHLKGRALPSIMALLEVTIVIGLISWATMPSIMSELQELGKIIDGITKGHIKLPKEYHTIIAFVNRYFDPNKAYAMVSNIKINELLKSGTSILEQSTEVILHVLSWLITIIYVLFILIDYPEIKTGFKLLAPQKYRAKFMMVFNDMATGMNHYFRGQGVVALCAMVLYCIGFLIVGLPLAIPMGVIVGFLYMIPYFQYITLIPVALICFVYSLGGEVSFFPELGKCILVYVVSQCVCDYLITPHVMGKELGLNPAIILLSLSVWGSILGIIGMIIALPVTAFIMQYYKTYISNRQ